MTSRLLALLMLTAAAPAPAAAPVAGGLPMRPARQLHFAVERGTWMSPDLSPDGKWLVFDLLGDVYRMPAAGGRALAITHGLAFDAQPVFSPDGRWIAFVSDRSGADNLWIMRADGRDARQLTSSDDDTIFASPAWRADGKAVFVSHYFSSLVQYELIEQPLEGKARVLISVRDRPGQPRESWRSALGAAASGDGKFLYYARRVGPLELEEPTPWQIVRRDVASGTERVILGETAGRGAPSYSFFRPQPSPDGRLLAYASRREGATELRLRDLATGEDRRLGDLDPDQLQAASWQDIVERFVFTRDGNALIVSREGGFERVPVDGSASTIIPFHADVTLDVGPSTRRRIRENLGPVRARLIQAPISSPDNSSIAFSALARIWVQPRRAGLEPRPLSPAGVPAFQPAWSPDGRRIAYVSWTERDGGAIWTADANGAPQPVRVTPQTAYYTYPVFTPDGGSLIALRSPTTGRQQATFEIGKLRQADLVLLPLDGGPARVLVSGRLGGRPHFGPDKGAVYLLSGNGLVAVDLASGAQRTVVQVKVPGYYFQEGSAAAPDLRISPDGKWLLAQSMAEQLHLVPMPAAGIKEVDIGDASSGSRQITDVGADFFEWRPDGSIEWSVGPYFDQAPAPGAGPVPAGRSEMEVVVTAPPAPVAGRMLLRHGRLLTMAQHDRVLPDADMLIENGRIAMIGPGGTITAPPDAKVVELAGRTVLPGFVDNHDHVGNVRRDVLGLEDWGLRARLAWGVTTSFDPSTLSIDALEYQDLLDAGLMVGPRLRSTGPALFSFNRFTSLGEVRTVLRRYRDAYRLDNLKEYRTGNRRVREWVAMAAREAGLQPTTEGALALKLDLSQIEDGFAGHEHVLPAPLQPDVLGLLAGMHTSYTTTLMTTNSGPPGADWFISQTDPRQDPKIRRFWPPSAIAQRLISRPWTSLSEERFPLAAAGAASVARSGGLVGMGAHGEVPGIGFHWEIAAHVMGGMTPMEALHAATAGSSETIGRLDDLGTIETGKIADLVVLDADPLADIANTQKIAWVIQSGRLFDAATLDELWPERRPLPPPWFAGEHVQQWLPTDPPAQP